MLSQPDKLLFYEFHAINSNENLFIRESVNGIFSV